MLDSIFHVDPFPLCWPQPLQAHARLSNCTKHLCIIGHARTECMRLCQVKTCDSDIIIPCTKLYVLLFLLQCEEHVQA